MWLTRSEPVVNESPSLLVDRATVDGARATSLGAATIATIGRREVHGGAGSAGSARTTRTTRTTGRTLDCATTSTTDGGPTVSRPAVPALRGERRVDDGARAVRYASTVGRARVSGRGISTISGVAVGPVALTAGAAHGIASPGVPAVASLGCNDVLALLDGNSCIVCLTRSEPVVNESPWASLLVDGATIDGARATSLSAAAITAIGRLGVHDGAGPTRTTGTTGTTALG
jgi:hypothetical protein